MKQKRDDEVKSTSESIEDGGAEAMRIEFSSLILATTGAIVLGSVCLADSIDVPVRVTQDYGWRYFCVTGDFTLGETAYSFEAPALEAPSTTARASTTEDDYWYFTADRDEGYVDYQKIPALLGLNNKLYRVQLDCDAKRFRLDPYIGETMLVDIAIETERLSLTGEGATPGVMFYRPGKQVAIPLGKYKLDQYQLVKIDETGVRWYVCAMGTDKSPELNVVDGSNVRLGIGAPYTPGVQSRIEKVAPGLVGWFLGRGEREAVALDFALFGRWNENASQVYPIGASTTPPAPKYKIRTADGEIVAQGRFRYG